MDVVRGKLDDELDAPRNADRESDVGAVVERGLALEVCGSERGPSVVLVHGAPDRGTSFRAVVSYLSTFRVVRYDRRGYGRSVDLRPAATMLDHAEDLVAALDRSQPPCVVVAHSFGSNPAMLAATFRPELFATMGVWEPPLPWVDWWPQSAKGSIAAIANADDPKREIEAVYRRLLGDQAWEALPLEVQERRRAEGRGLQVDMASSLMTPFAIDDVTVPTLVGHGTATSWEYARGAAWLAEQLPHARLHVVPGAGHFANRTHAKDFADFVRAVVTYT